MRSKSRGGWFVGRLWLLAALAAIGLAGPGLILAQEATPDASPVASPGASPVASPGASPVASPVGDLVPDTAPDLAAMMLRSNDLEEGYGLSQGALWGLDVEVSNIAESLGRNPEDLREELTDAGWQLRYLAYFGVPDEADTTFITEGTTSYVTLYEDAAGAELGFAVTEDEGETEDIEDVADAPELGDESELTRITGTDEATGNPFTSLDYAFRVDNLIAGVSVTDFSGEEPNQDEVIALAELVLERIETVLDGDAPELFGRLLRLEPGQVATTQYATEYYLLIDGDYLRFYNEPEDAVTQRSDFLGENEVEATYQYEGYFLPTNVTDPNQSLAVITRLYSFADEEAAAAFVDTAAQDLVDDPIDYENVERLDDVPDFAGADGGAASGVSYDFPISEEVAASGFRYWVQTGSTVVSVQADRVDGLSEDAVVDLVQTQLACITQDTLCEPVAPWEELLGE